MINTITLYPCRSTLERRLGISFDMMPMLLGNIRYHQVACAQLQRWQVIANENPGGVRRIYKISY